jgi:hypothetical protein
MENIEMEYLPIGTNLSILSRLWAIYISCIRWGKIVGEV